MAIFLSLEIATMKRTSSQPSYRKQAKKLTTRLSLEQLEDRCAPAVFTWIPPNPANLDYDNPMNWFDANGQRPVQAPTANDDVVFTANNNDVCNATGVITVQKLTIQQGHTARINVSDLSIANGGEIADGELRNGAVHVLAGGDTLTWKGGTIRTQFWVDANAYMEIRPSEVEKKVVEGGEGGDIHNFGRISWQIDDEDDTIFLSDTATIENEANSWFRILGMDGATATVGSSTDVGSFVVKSNAQLIARTGIEIQIHSYFENAGVVDASGTRLYTYGGFLASGTFQLPGSTWFLPLDRGHPTAIADVTISQGAAQTYGHSGDLSVAGTNTISSGASFRQIDNTNLFGSGTINVRGFFNWGGGKWDALDGTAQMHIFPNASLVLGDINPPPQAPLAQLAMINGWTLYNEGTVSMGSSTLTIGGQFQPAQTITNDGVFDIRGNYSILHNQTGEALTFSNTGTLKKSAGAGTSMIDMALLNSGEFRHDAGRMVFTYIVRQVAPGQVFLNGNIIGAPLFAFDGGTVSIDGGTIEATFGVQLAAGATFSGWGNIIGDVTNAGSFAAGPDDSLTVAGNFTQTDGTTTVSSGLSVSGLFQIDGGSVAVAAVPVTVGALEQNGGALALATGSVLTVNGDYAITGGTASVGWQFSGASIAGQLLLSGGTLTLANVYNLTVSGGVQVEAGGTLNLVRGNLTADVTNAGTIMLGPRDFPAPWDEYTLHGNYTQTAAAKLIADADSYGGYDYLIVTGLATLAGTLQLTLSEGYSPSVGAVLNPLTYGSRSGTFDTLGLPVLVEGVWDPRYDDPSYPNSLSLWVIDDEPGGGG